MNETKILNFKYGGGTEEITLNVMPYALPITYRFDNTTEWVTIDIDFTKVTFTVKPTFDYKSRTSNITLLNSVGSEIPITIIQSGYEGIGLECDNNVVLHHSYYDMSNNYNFYVTVYGGQTQELKCGKLQNYIEKVWDNSDMYNTFIIKIPDGLNGKYLLKHSEYSNYKKYCKSCGIDFDEKKVAREINIVQISENDTVGNMCLKYNGNIYETRSEIPVTISSEKDSIIQIISTEYYHQISRTKYEIIDNKEVDLSECPMWISSKIDNNSIILKATEINRLTPRLCKLRVTNRTNSHQYVDLLIKQESGT